MTSHSYDVTQVRSLFWCNNDLYLVLTGVDGAVYQWNIFVRMFIPRHYTLVIGIKTLVPGTNTLIPQH